MGQEYFLNCFIVFYRMKNFFPLFSRDKASSSANVEAMETQHPNEGIEVVDYELLETDPGIRPPISSYHPNIQNEVRKTYLKLGRHNLLTVSFTLGLFKVNKDVGFANIGLICMNGLIIVNLRT
jgi:hypothetical protein